MYFTNFSHSVLASYFYIQTRAGFDLRSLHADVEWHRARRLLQPVKTRVSILIDRIRIMAPLSWGLNGSPHSVGLAIYE